MSSDSKNPTIFHFLVWAICLALGVSRITVGPADPLPHAKRLESSLKPLKKFLYEPLGQIQIRLTLLPIKKGLKG
jgi:hypothetical protein